MHRRQVWLFVLVVLLPSAILVALGVRMLSQERELTGKRVADDQKRFAEDSRRDMLRRIGEQSPDGWQLRALDESRILAFRGKRPPWEANRDAQIAWQLVREPAFSDPLAKNDFDAALAAAHHPVQRAYARLKQAVHLEEAGRTSEAFQFDLEVMRRPGLLVDESGVPFRLRAAARLASAGVMQQEVANLLHEELYSYRPLPPAEIAIAKQMVKALAKHQPSAAEARLLGQRLEAAEEYNSTIRQLLSSAVAPGVWHSYASGFYLGTHTKDESIMVRLRPLVTSLPGRILVLEPEQGHSLAPEFPDLSLILDPSVDRSVAQRWSLLWWFYAIALLLVLGVSLFGGYLLWRDVNRDMKMAQERSQFIAGVSHELRTPLTAIRMYAETLAMGRAATPEVSQQYIETILTEGERLSRLVDNVLDFARIEQGKRLYRFRPCSLQEVVRASVQALAKPLEHQGFAVQMEIDETVPEVQADPDALMRAMLNLLSNAMKYSGQSRVIEVKLAARHSQVAIRVRDYGFGLPESEQLQIFEKFYRAPQPDGQNVPGTGLGLTLVKHVVEEHGGRVEVKSQPGQGSVFSILLPLDRERSERNRRRTA